MEQKDNIKVSVCISVHNTEKYLPRCLDSVCNQTLKDIEIVLVNNGSTDNSEAIMQEYAKRYPERTFVIVSQEDKSLAGGRQTGINHATGTFITFLDADDMVDLTAYEKMLSCAIRENVDIVEIETLRDGKIISSPLDGTQNTHSVLKRYLTKGDVPSMLWLRMYKRSLFKNTLIPTIYTNNEDVFAWPCLLYAGETIFYIKEPLHTYSTDNENGVMHSEKTNPDLAKKRFQSKTKALLAIPHFCSFIGVEGENDFYKEINYYKANRIFNFLLEDFGGKSIEEKEDAAVRTLAFGSSNEMKAYLNKWLPSKLFSMYGVYRLFGMKAAYKVIQYKTKNKK